MPPIEDNIGSNGPSNTTNSAYNASADENVCEAAPSPQIQTDEVKEAEELAKKIDAYRKLLQSEFDKKIHIAKGYALLTMIVSLDLMPTDEVSDFLNDHELINPLAFPPFSFAATALGASAASEQVNKHILKRLGLTTVARGSISAAAETAAAQSGRFFLANTSSFYRSLATLAKPVAWLAKTTFGIGPSSFFANFCDNLIGDTIENSSKEHGQIARRKAHFLSFFAPEALNWASKNALLKAIYSLRLGPLFEGGNLIAGTAFALGFFGYSYEFISNRSSTSYVLSVNSRASKSRHNSVMWEYGFSPLAGAILDPVLCSDTNPFGTLVGKLEKSMVSLGLKDENNTCHALIKHIRSLDQDKVDRYLPDVRRTILDLVAFGRLPSDSKNSYITYSTWSKLINDGWLESVSADQIQFKYDQLKLSDDEKIDLANKAFIISQLFTSTEESTPLRRILSYDLMEKELSGELKTSTPHIDFFRKERFGELVEWLGADRILGERKILFCKALIRAKLAKDLGVIDDYDTKLLELGRKKGFIKDSELVKTAHYYTALKQYRDNANIYESIALSFYEEHIIKKFYQTGDTYYLLDLIILESDILLQSKQPPAKPANDAYQGDGFDRLFKMIFSDVNIEKKNVRKDVGKKIGELRRYEAFMQVLKSNYSQAEMHLHNRLISELAIDGMVKGTTPDFQHVDNGDLPLAGPFARANSTLSDGLRHDLAMHKLMADILGDASDTEIVLYFDKDGDIQGPTPKNFAGEPKDPKMKELAKDLFGHTEKLRYDSVAAYVDDHGDLKDPRVAQEMLLPEVNIAITLFKGGKVGWQYHPKIISEHDKVAVHTLVKLRRKISEMHFKAYAMSLTSGKDSYELMAENLVESKTPEIMADIKLLAAYYSISPDKCDEIWEVFKDGIFTDDGRIASVDKLIDWAVEYKPLNASIELEELKKFIKDSELLLEAFAYFKVDLEDDDQGFEFSTTITMERDRIASELQNLQIQYCKLSPANNGPLMLGHDNNFKLWGASGHIEETNPTDDFFTRAIRKKMDGQCNNVYIKFDDIGYANVDRFLADDDNKILMPDGSIFTPPPETNKEKRARLFDKIVAKEKFIDWLNKVLDVLKEYKTRYHGKRLTQSPEFISLIRENIKDANWMMERLESSPICTPPIK